jgi:hypothetical protein
MGARFSGLAIRGETAKPTSQKLTSSAEAQISPNPLSVAESRACLCHFLPAELTDRLVFVILYISAIPTLSHAAPFRHHPVFQ